MKVIRGELHESVPSHRRVPLLGCAIPARSAGQRSGPARPGGRGGAGALRHRLPSLRHPQRRARRAAWPGGDSNARQGALSVVRQRPLHCGRPAPKLCDFRADGLRKDNRLGSPAWQGHRAVIGSQGVSSLPASQRTASSGSGFFATPGGWTICSSLGRASRCDAISSTSKCRPAATPAA